MLRTLNTLCQLQVSTLLHGLPYAAIQLNKAKLLSQQLKTTTEEVEKKQLYLNDYETAGEREQQIFDEYSEGEIAELQARNVQITAHTPVFFPFLYWRFLSTPAKRIGNDKPPTLLLCLMWRLAATLLITVMALLRQPKPAKVSAK